jgi:hypothetical protein
VLQAHARAEAWKQEAVTTVHSLSVQIQAHEKGMQQLQRQIDGGSFAVGPRPPKHAGKAAALQARERRFSCAQSVTGSLRGARATGALTVSHFTCFTSTKVQTLISERGLPLRRARALGSGVGRRCQGAASVARTRLARSARGTQADGGIATECARRKAGGSAASCEGAQFTCFTGTRVHILTQKALRY